MKTYLTPINYRFKRATFKQLFFKFLRRAFLNTSRNTNNQFAFDHSTQLIELRVQIFLFSKSIKWLRFGTKYVKKIWYHLSHLTANADRVWFLVQTVCSGIHLSVSHFTKQFTGFSFDDFLGMCVVYKKLLSKSLLSLNLKRKVVSCGTEVW